MADDKVHEKVLPISLLEGLSLSGRLLFLAPVLDWSSNSLERSRLLNWLGYLKDQYEISSFSFLFWGKKKKLYWLFFSCGCKNGRKVKLRAYA